MDNYSEKTVESFDGTKIWYRIVGSGAPTLVLCDGVGCAGYVWKYLIPHFSGRHRIVHWNYRGHGKSAAPADIDNLGIEECCQDLEAVLDDAGEKDPVVLLGHSMGVQVILEFCHRHPERVCALVALTGSYGRAVDHVHDSSVVKTLFPLMKQAVESLNHLVRPLWRNLIHSQVAYHYATLFEINGSLIKKEDFYPYLEQLANMDPVVFVKTLEGAARHTAEPYLSEITQPTLIIAGERDRFTPHWISRRMQSLMQAAKLQTLPLASHTGPIEMPDLTNLSIEKFLSEIGDCRKTPSH